MHRLTLTPETREIIVNGAAGDGSVDLFSYGPDEPSAHALGSLYVIGSHTAESSTMDYMVSLVAAMARREYYAQPTALPREAFAHALRKVNEVVEEFFRSEGITLAVGILAIAGGTVMVSKLDKFRILLARNGEVIDILNNVILFSKEHVEQRRFSSIIHGSVQDGDRLLAYIPTKPIAAKERSLKMWLGKTDAETFAQHCTKLGDKNTTFSAALLRIDMTQVAHLTENQPMPVMATAPAPIVHTWAPRQASHQVIPEKETVIPTIAEETPRIIASEFSRGIRQNHFSRMLGHIRFVRLDGRGKAAVVGVLAMVIIAGALVMKSALFVSPEEQKLHTALTEIQSDLTKARTTASDQPGEARGMLMRALATLGGYQQNDTSVRSLTADILTTMDGLDHATSVIPTSIATLDVKTDHITLTTWASSSQSLWAVTSDEDNRAAVRIANGEVAQRIPLPAGFEPAFMAGWKDGILLLDATRSLLRISNAAVKQFELPISETPQDMAVFNDILYLLTDQSILKISDLDTNKPVTKPWLTDASQLATQAARIFVDASIYTISRDGTLTNYYKNKRTTSVAIGLAPTGAWRLIPFMDGKLAVTSADRTRVYVIHPDTGSLERTLTVESDQPFLLMAPGPDGSAIAVSKDNRIWEIK